MRIRLPGSGRARGRGERKRTVRWLPRAQRSIATSMVVRPPATRRCCDGCARPGPSFGGPLLSTRSMTAFTASSMGEPRRRIPIKCHPEQLTRRPTLPRVNANMAASPRRVQISRSLRAGTPSGRGRPQTGVELLRSHPCPTAQRELGLRARCQLPYPRPPRNGGQQG